MNYFTGRNSNTAFTKNYLPLTYNLSSQPLILLVEDDPLIQKVHRLMLEKLGCIVDIASNAQQALALLNRKYNAILMDIGLPDIDGIQITSEIRRREKTKKRISIIALTAYVCEETKQECLAAGADEVATKPIKLERLEILLKKWLAK